jgi:hypothetical protein
MRRAVVRAADAAQDQPVEPSPGPSTPVQVEVSEELVKLNQEVYQRFKAGEFGQALPIAEQALGIAERSTALPPRRRRRAQICGASAAGRWPERRG